MIKVITYGTFDRLHYGHIRLLERAKALGDYLIVGITSDAFDIQRGKINVSENLIKRIENVKATGLCDEIIVEEYPGQKIDDIKKFNIDIFAIGSDWIGQFDYLKEYCKVVYLDRTQGVSSSMIRAHDNMCNLSIVDTGEHISSILSQVHFVNGIEVSSVYITDKNHPDEISKITQIDSDINDALTKCNSVFVSGEVENRYKYSKFFLENNKNVLCSLPGFKSFSDYKYLKQLAQEKGLKYIPSTNFHSSLLYNHFLTLVKSQSIGKILSINININAKSSINDALGSLFSALVTVFEIFELNFTNIEKYFSNEFEYGRISITYPIQSALIQISPNLQNHDEIFILGTEGYGKISSSWESSGHIKMTNTKTNKETNVNYDGNGIKYELLSLIKNDSNPISDEIIEKITEILT